MMHGGGKSDEAVVAVKPANKAEQSAAELVERRAEAEGNASQHHTCRTSDLGAGAHTAKSQGQEEGEVHRAPAPHQRPAPRNGILRIVYMPQREWTATSASSA
jgi:hypothetical protein